MKSGKQRRAELQAKKDARAPKPAAETPAKQAALRHAEAEWAASQGAPLNRSALALTSSYSGYSYIDFVARGYYLDVPFTCQDCGKDEIWTATQQKWWYEVAKGDVNSTARRCRQ